MQFEFRAQGGHAGNPYGDPPQRVGHGHGGYAAPPPRCSNPFAERRPGSATPPAPSSNPFNETKPGFHARPRSTTPHASSRDRGPCHRGHGISPRSEGIDNKGPGANRTSSKETVGSAGVTRGRGRVVTDDCFDIAEMMQNKDMLRDCAQRPFRTRAPGSRLNFQEFREALRDIIMKLRMKLPSDKQLFAIYEKHRLSGGVGPEEFEALLFRMLCFLRASDELDVTPTKRDNTPTKRDMCWREEFIQRNPRRFNEVYEIQKELGKGNFGTVYKVVHKGRSGKQIRQNDQNFRVCKVMSKALVQQNGAPLAKVREELSVLKLLDHPHVLRIFEDFEDEKAFFLIMEPCQGGDLQEFMQKLEPMDAPEYEYFVAKVLQHTLSAIAYSHQKGVVHKDLKPENIMLSTPRGTRARDIHVVVVDFGLAEMFHRHNDRSKVVSGTPPYMAPEVWNGNSGKSCDVWSCGVILFYLLAGRLPFVAARAEDFARITVIQEPDWMLMGGASREALGICKDMLAKQEQFRPTATAALNSPWFVKLRLARGSNRGARTLSPDQISSLKDLGERTEFEKFFTRLVATQIGASQQQSVNEVFRALDTNGDGILSCRELGQGLLALGVSQGHAEWVVDELDVGGKGEISYTEFLAGFLNLQAQSPAEQDRLLRIAWLQFSPDERGLVHMNSIQDALAARGMTVADIPSELLNALRRDASGTVTFKCFRDLLLEGKRRSKARGASRSPSPIRAIAKLWARMT